jgi:hypothetical protein
MAFDAEFFPDKTAWGGKIGAGWSNRGPYLQIGDEPPIGPGSDLVQRYQDWRATQAASDEFRSRLELADANHWYRNGQGREMNVDIRSISFPAFSSMPPDGDIQLHFASLDGYTTYNDAAVYGTATFNVKNGRFIGGFDYYDFKHHEGGNSFWRNASTVAGGVNAGIGTPYRINFRGSQPIKLLSPPPAPVFWYYY